MWEGTPPEVIQSNPLPPAKKKLCSKELAFLQNPPRWTYIPISVFFWDVFEMPSQPRLPLRVVVWRRVLCYLGGRLDVLGSQEQLGQAAAEAQPLEIPDQVPVDDGMVVHQLGLR